MEHLPFEHWILNDEPITNEQSYALADHLETCPHCRQLQTGWQAARGRMRSAEMTTPVAGFASRWQASLGNRRVHEQNLQVRRTFLFLGVGAILSFVVLMVWILAGSSPVDWTVSLLGFTLRAAVRISDIVTYLSSWWNALPKTIPLAIWIYLSSVFALLALGWLFVLWRVTTQGVENK